MTRSVYDKRLRTIYQSFTFFTYTFNALQRVNYPVRNKFIVLSKNNKCRKLKLFKEFADLFIRIHRNCLVARRRIRGFERLVGDEAEAGWAVLLEGCGEKLPVSRRQWVQVKALVSS